MQQYDLIAIQELRDIAALERCVSELASRSRKYSFVASKPVGTSKSKELYAYLYRPDVVSHLGDPSIYDDHADRFIREPYIAHFRSGTFDFTMITTHILYGSGKKDPARAGELNAIADVFRQIQNADPSENDIILTGDFNEPPDSPRFAALVSIPTLQMIIQGTNVRTVIHDSSLYDNIVFQSQYTDREYTGIWGVYKFDEEMFGNDDQMASKVCSDHRPVWADFRTDAGDDD
jgi:endonuclease/exonuclease/phosphatase family metal-dependent hydrolase